MLLSIPEKKMLSNEVLFDKITENEQLLYQANLELREVTDLLNNLEDVIKNDLIGSYEHLLPETIIPSSMKGISKKNFQIYVEDELIEKVKKILRKVVHFIFGSVTDSIDYMKSEVDYLERIKKSLQTYHRMFTNSEDSFHKTDFLKKSLAIWDYNVTDQKTRAIKDLINMFEQILQKDNSIKKEDFDLKKFNDTLVKLGYTFDRDNKKASADESQTFSIDKQVVEDMHWTYGKVKDQLTFLLSIFESRKVFDKLLDKLEQIKKQSQNTNTQLNSINDKDKIESAKTKVYDLKDEVIFIESVRKIIMKHLHALSHQLFILIKNMQKKD